MKFVLDKNKFDNTLNTTTFEKMKNLEAKETFDEAKKNKKTGEMIKFFNLGAANDWKQFLDLEIRNSYRYR